MMINQHASLTNAIDRLATREIQVLTRLLKGGTEKEIAQQLDLRPNTVHGYVKTIYRILHVTSRAELMAMALDAMVRSSSDSEISQSIRRLVLESTDDIHAVAA